jgi:hypothetical protein
MVGDRAQIWRQGGVMTDLVGDFCAVIVREGGRSSIHRALGVYWMPRHAKSGVPDFAHSLMWPKSETSNFGCGA